MARAKRTDRADARRRYRATQVTPDTEDDESGPDAAAPASGRAADAPATRPGLAGVIGSVRLPNARQDLAAMPTVIRTTPGVWAAFALGVVAIVAGLTFPLNDATLGAVILPLLVQPPGIPVLLGGFFAPRGAWFIGGLLGVMQTIGFFSYVLRGSAATAALDAGGILGVLLFYVVLGATFAALASWYRGWLRKMSTRNAAMRAEREKQQRRDTKRSTRPAR